MDLNSPCVKETRKASWLNKFAGQTNVADQHARLNLPPAKSAGCCTDNSAMLDVLKCSKPSCRASAAAGARSSCLFFFFFLPSWRQHVFICKHLCLGCQDVLATSLIPARRKSRALLCLILCQFSLLRRESMSEIKVMAQLLCFSMSNEELKIEGYMLNRCNMRKVIISLARCFKT